MKKHLLLSIVCLFCAITHSLGTVDVRSTFMTTADGLPNNSIYCMLQDSKGFIWLGTLNGLGRYDGNSFITYLPENNSTNDRISLATNHVRSLSEDRNGFLWMETAGEFFNCYDMKKECFVDFTGCGEYRENYDRKIETSEGDVWLWNSRNGCRKITYQNNTFSSTTYKESLGNLISDSVAYVYQDPNNNIWVGTSKGVAKIEGNKSVVVEQKNTFAAQGYRNSIFFLSKEGIISTKEGDKPLKRVAQIPRENNQTTVTGTLLMDNEWVIFTSAGGYVLNMSTCQLTQSGKLNIRNGRVQTDNTRNYWVYNHSGNIWYVNTTTGNVKVLKLSTPEKLNYVDVERYHIVHDSRGIIWISTYGNGLYAYDTSTDELQNFDFKINGFNHISSNYLQYIIEDRSGCIWVSSEYTGVARLTILNEGIQRIYPEEVSCSDRSNTVRMITRLKNDEICIGTRGGGVYRYDKEIKQQKEKLYFNSSIYAIAQDSTGVDWTGSRGEGLSIGGRWYTYQSDDEQSISNNHIFNLYCDHKGRMWIGTFGGGLNLAVKEKNGYSFKHFFNKRFAQQRIRAIMEDDNGWMWIGSSDGIYIFQPDSLIANPNNYLVYNYNNGKLNSNEVKCIYQDSKKQIWIGTSGGGLSRCTLDSDYTNLNFKHYGISNGLVNNMVQAIVEDKQGKLWVATEYGISRFNTEMQHFDNFFFSPQTLGDVFSDNSSCISKDGRLLFGTNYGLLIINPEEIGNDDIQSPAVTFTNLQVNGITMRPGDVGSPLSKAMMYTERINLKYSQSSFTIDFSTFDYSESNSYLYTYHLANYDKEWSKPSQLNFASYKNIPPGTYRLRVKVYNATGMQGEQEAVMKIVITPPFWKTTWASLIYTILLIIVLYVAYRLVFNFNLLRNKVEVEKQLTEYKLVFFTNISHEFRTPLTLIQGALENIQNIDKIPKEMSNSLKVMNKSTGRMLRLINQLLEFRKMQNNKLALSLEETDVMGFLHEIFLSFQDTATSKNMDFVFQPSVASFKMFIDKGNMDKVVYNLLSNAFKYTPSGGRVVLYANVDEEKHHLEITVSDTGIGIDKDKRDQLFKRFMQSNFSNHSTGIGLHLTHELVNVHKGSIAYSENPDGGSMFTVLIPTTTEVYEEEDFLIPHKVLMEEGVKEKDNKEDEKDVSDRQSHIKPQEPSNPHKLLIIEDDDDVREFLKAEFSPYFEVVTEADGVAGLEKAREYDADIIICDVLMPGLTGFEVTRKLKSDFATSHIPIILLTAMSSAENHLKGVESGADAYITKPFSPKLLLAKTFQLIKQREKLRRKFSDEPGTIAPAICTSEKDKQFADKLHTIMEEQIGNSEFAVDDIASIMGLGRSTFYRKVRGVTGYSPNEYLRIIRMKKAAELLMENKYTVAEVSYKVGIEDPFYFSKCFKKQFGQSPSIYLRGKSNADEKDNSRIEESEDSIEGEKLLY